MANDPGSCNDSRVPHSTASRWSGDRGGATTRGARLAAVATGLLAAVPLVLWLVVVAASVGLGYRVRDHALRRLSTFYTGDMAVLWPARLQEEELRAAVRVATSGAEARDRIGRASCRERV